MKKIKYSFLVSLTLIGLSFVLFSIHFAVFGQLQNTLYYSLMSLCFIPINVLAVTMVFEKILAYQVMQEKLSKMNMLIGVYFSELGFTLLDLIVSGDVGAKELMIDFSDLKAVKTQLKNHPHKLSLSQVDYAALSKLLIDRVSIVTTLITTETILEHEAFSDLLMATIHLRDEILFRQDKPYTEDDYLHITGDITRVYKALSLEWIDYLIHINANYPYLYKSAIDVSPFHKK